MAPSEYLVWDVYTNRLVEAGLDKKVAREIIDMIVTQTVNEGRLKAALEGLESRIGEKIVSSAATQEQVIEARVNHAVNVQTKWIIGAIFVAAGLVVAAMELLA